MLDILKKETLINNHDYLLINEAKKYKSFDEFKKTQGQTLYHWSDNASAINKEWFKIMPIKTWNAYWEWIYLATTKSNASWYITKSDNDVLINKAKLSKNIDEFINKVLPWWNSKNISKISLDNLTKIYNKAKIDTRWVVKAYIINKWEILDSNEFNPNVKELIKKWYIWIRNNNWDIVIFDNNNNIKTEVQLKQIYEQAHKMVTIKRKIFWF